MCAQHSKFEINVGFSFSKLSSSIPCGQPANVNTSCEGNMSTFWSPSVFLSSFDTSTKEVVQINEFNMIMDNSGDRFNSPKRKLARTGLTSG